MSRVRSILILSAILCALLAPGAFSQGAPFTIEVIQNDTTDNITDGGTVAMVSPAVGLAANASLTFTYTGTLATTITAIDLTGSRDFSLSHGALPFPVEPGGTFLVKVQYLPMDGDQKDGLITVTYLDEGLDKTVTVNLTGTTPVFAYSYTPAGGNASQIEAGGTLQFPETNLDATSTATFVVTNVGTAAGAVNSIGPNGSEFAVTGLPLLPTDVAPNGELRFSVTFTPGQLGTRTGALNIGLADGTTSFTLEGESVGSLFTYELLVNDQTVPVQPGEVIRVEDALVGETTSAVMRVRNTGNTEGAISTIAASGDAYAVSELPFLPVTLPPGGTTLFTISFTPDQIGQLVGRLKVGVDEFDLLGSGIGSFLEYTTTSGGTTTTIEDNGTVIFTPAAVGGSSSVSFTVKNTGTTTSTITSISLATTGSAYVLSGLPGLPLDLAPGNSASFTIKFEPLSEGAATDTLVVDAATFTLSGTATPPAPLPSYVFDGASGVQEPKTQPAVGLTLSEAYPSKVTGTLTLAFASEAFADDPTVVFSNGTRKVDFEIPAGETKAVFPNGTNMTKVQTGTVAGTITLTPSFATEGGADLTPSSPVTQMMSVVEAAPVITSGVISEKRASSMTLSVTGFSTARSVTQITLQFATRSGENVATSSASISAETQFSAWYQSSQSTAFGSQFQVTIPLSFSGSTNEVAGLSNAIESITVTLTNAQGTSASLNIANPEGI